MKKKTKSDKEIDAIFKHNEQARIQQMRADIDLAEAKGENTLELKREYDLMVERASMPRQNRIMWYVIRACNQLDIELEEVYCTNMKCIYRFPGESEEEAHMFMYGTSADYEQILNVIRDEV